MHTPTEYKISHLPLKLESTGNTTDANKEIN